MVTHPSRVDALVRNAYRRCLLVLGVEQTARAAALPFAGLVLLLLLGTQILNWYWLAPLVLAGIALAYWRVRRRGVTPYSVAQAVDHQFQLKDTISTAWYLKQHPELSDMPAASVQIAQADRLAADIDPNQVFRVRGRGAWAILAVLATTAFALFGVRYFAQQGMDMRAPLVPLHFDQIAAGLKDEFAAVDHSRSKTGSPTDQSDSDTQTERPTDPFLKDILGVKNPESAATQQAKGPSPSSSVQSPSDKADTSDSENGQEASGKPNSKGTASDDNSANAQQSAEKKTSPSDANQQNSGLMDRMKDAVSSLFAKMNESPPSQSSQTASRNAAAPDKQQKGGKSEQGQSQSSSSQNSQTKSDAQSQSDQRGQASEVAQSAQSQTSQASDRQGGNQSKSGIGRQDGQKDLKEAQQQEAMGKLAQIIGKRSERVTGEMMVEVPSGKQKLRTAYSGELGEHADTGGEVNRDEVPLIYQDYVREYMQRVHRQAEHNN